MSNITKDLRNIEETLTDLYIYIPHAQHINQKISSVNVGWHIEHTLLVILKISESVIRSNPDKYKWKFNLARLLVFPLNKFPRGKGKAPDIVKPKQIVETDFESMFDETRKILKKLSTTSPHQHFFHPIFGTLNKKNTFIMLGIHTRHHLHIIKDILAA